MERVQRIRFDVVVCVLVLGLCTAVRAGIYYVDAAAVGAGDGSSWTDAFVHLQDALAIVGAGDEIRVAQGVYKPDQGASVDLLDRDTTFTLVDGVAILGGYAGVQAVDPNARDIEQYETILSGDLNGDDGPDFTNLSDNSRLGIVTASGITDANTLIEGFTITASYYFAGVIRRSMVRGAHIAGVNTVVQSLSVTGGDGSVGGGIACTESCLHVRGCRVVGNWARSGGGGLRCADSSLVLEDCTFESNLARYGAGLSCSGTVVLHQCQFTDNVAEGDGGGVYIAAGASVTFDDCLLEGNSAEYGGGLCNCSDDGVALTGCRIIGNTAEEHGGGMRNRGEAVLTGCHFAQNMACMGGALHDYNSESIVTECIFENNQASGYSGLGGAGIVAIGGTAHVVPQPVSWGPTFVRCRFIRNRAEGLAGGGLYCGGCVPTLVRCLFVGNLAGQGGAVYSRRSKPKLSNCTIAQNRASNMAGIYEVDSEVVLDYCIVWDNEGGQMSDTVSAINSIIDGGWSGSGNSAVDPLFVLRGDWRSKRRPDDPDNLYWVDGDYHLKSQAGRWDPEAKAWVRDEVTSPCIDAGDPEGPIGDEPFPNGGVANMGAYGGSVEASSTYFDTDPAEVHLAGDINGDGRVGYADLAIIVLQWTEGDIPSDR